MATDREKEIGKELFEAAIASGATISIEVVAELSAYARKQAAAERAAKREAELKAACKAFGYPVNRCTKCDGNKFLPHYAGISGGRCYACNGKGWTRA